MVAGTKSYGKEDIWKKVEKLLNYAALNIRMLSCLTKVIDSLEKKAQFNCIS